MVDMTQEDREDYDAEPIPIVETGTAIVRPLRAVLPTVFIIHTTGDTDEDACDRYYRKGKIGPHAMINATGVIRRYIPEDRTAAHAGITAAQLAVYKAGTWRTWIKDGDNIKDYGSAYPGYQMWDQRWGSGHSPLHLLTGARPNAVSIGIECLASHHRLPTVFTDEQYDSMAAYIREQASRFRIPIDRQHLLGHYDVNPIARANKSGDIDPGAAFDWTRLITACTV